MPGDERNFIFEIQSYYNFKICVLFFKKVHALGIDDILKLVNFLTDRYLGLSIIITTLGSWSNGFMHYPPLGLIKISDSHSFQLLVEMNGVKKTIELFEMRSKIVRFFSACSIHIMILIKISIIIQFSLESELHSYSHIKEDRFRRLLLILQSQFNTLLKNNKVLETRNEIHRYVNEVCLANKSWKIKTEKTLDSVDATEPIPQSLAEPEIVSSALGVRSLPALHEREHVERID